MDETTIEKFNEGTAKNPIGVTVEGHPEAGKLVGHKTVGRKMLYKVLFPEEHDFDWFPAEALELEYVRM